MYKINRVPFYCKEYFPLYPTAGSTLRTISHKGRSAERPAGLAAWTEQAEFHTCTQATRQTGNHKEESVERATYLTTWSQREKGHNDTWGTPSSPNTVWRYHDLPVQKRNLSQIFPCYSIWCLNSTIHYISYAIKYIETVLIISIAPPSQ